MPNPENLKEPWKEGDPSPNPSGRPKGSRNLSTILKEMLEEEIEVTTETGKEKKKLQDVIVRKLIRAASKPGELKPTELRAIQEIFDRTEGKAKQEIEQSGGTSITVKWDNTLLPTSHTESPPQE